MELSTIVTQYVVFDAEQLLRRPIVDPLEKDEVEKALHSLFKDPLPFSVESLLSANFHSFEPRELPLLPATVAVLVSPDASTARVVRGAFDQLIARTGESRVTGIGANPGIGLADFSLPNRTEVPLFGTREDAHRLSRIDGLPSALTGDGINVVVVDAGLDASLIPFGQWGGGWQPSGGPVPGTTTGENAVHGMMIVQNILAVAPLARIWDVPLIPPPRINNLTSFLATAQATFDAIKSTIDKINQLQHQQWVFVNAWAIFDRRSEVPFLGDYTENRPGNPFPHPFIRRIEDLAYRRFDIVFCAGNCGGVCPDGRCGPNDIGPGRDIWGANAHASVLTVGAVRIDTNWIGYSSEGPGPGNKLASQKPDLCVPSHYAETHGQFPPNVGTSAASALAAGVVTAFRSRWSQAVVSPSTLIQRLNTNAQKTNGPTWTPRLGNGILNAQSAFAALP